MNPTESLTQIGKYKILSELGRGGMGVVYRAEDRFIGREVAIKTLVDASPAMRQRFAIEARSGVLNHPNIVTIYDFGEHEDNPYIVMEFLHGRTLERIIKEDQPLALVVKLDIVRQVCEGLGYAHSRGVVHRDIKPANVVLLQNGVVKLVDFGIAQLESLSGHTVAGSVIGTYQYLSPERLKGEASDGRGDIWSAGVLLYLLLTGALPFPGEDISALHHVITDPYPPLGTLLSTAYPESLDNIIARALAKDPKQRYADATEMAGDLEAIRDAIRLSKVEDLLGQARTLIDRDELLRARPLLLDLQRLAPQNMAVRTVLRELGERLKSQPELRSAAFAASPAADGSPADPSGAVSKNGHVPAAEDHRPTQDPQQLAASQEEERRRGIIEQIVTEIRAQAERGNEPRALELVQRSLQRAPGNAALLALETEIQTRIRAVGAEPASLENHLSPAQPVPAQPLPAQPLPAVSGTAAASIPANLDSTSAQEKTGELEQLPAQVLPPQVSSLEGPAEPETNTAAITPEVPETSVESASDEIALPEPVPTPASGAAAPRGITPVQPPPPATAFATVPAPRPTPVPVPTPVPEPKGESAQPGTAAAIAPAVDLVAVGITVSSVTKPPAEVSKPPAVPTTTVVMATSDRVDVAKTSAIPQAGRSKIFNSPLLPLLAGFAVILLGALLALLLRHHRQPIPLPSTYVVIVASPYAQVTRLATANGEGIALAPGDHMTPLRVNDLRPGAYTLALQAPGGQQIQARCNVDAGQHLCLAVVAPLSDADIQEILAGGPRP